MGFKKIVAKEVVARELIMGFQILVFYSKDFIYNATKGQDTKWEMKVKSNMA
jgi:hypothetical protein